MKKISTIICGSTWRAAFIATTPGNASARTLAGGCFPCLATEAGDAGSGLTLTTTVPIGSWYPTCCLLVWFRWIENGGERLLFNTQEVNTGPRWHVIDNKMKLFCGRQLLQAFLLDIFPHAKPTWVGKTLILFRKFHESILEFLEFFENLLDFSEKIERKAFKSQVR